MSATLVGAGAAKIVYTTAVDPDLVFYIPQQTPLTHISFPWAKSELQQEVSTCAKIKKAVEKTNQSSDHLAISLTPSKKSINGQYTVQAEKARGD